MSYRIRFDDFEGRKLAALFDSDGTCIGVGVAHIRLMAAQRACKEAHVVVGLEELMRLVYEATPTVART